MALMWSGGEETGARPDEGPRRRIAELEGKLRSLEEQTALHRITMDRQVSEHRARVEQLQTTLELTRCENKEWRERCAAAEAAEGEAKRKREVEERETQRLRARSEEMEAQRSELEAQVEELKRYQEKARELGNKCRSLEDLVNVEKMRREEAERKREDTSCSLLAKEAQFAEEYRTRIAAEGRNANLLHEMERKTTQIEERAKHAQSLLEVKERELEVATQALTEAEETASRRISAIGAETVKETRKLRDRCNLLEQRVISFNEASKSLEETERDSVLADQRARESLRALAVEQANRQTLEAHVRLLEAKLKDAQGEREHKETAAKRLARELEEARLQALTRQRAALTERGRSAEELAADLAQEKRAHALLRAAYADLEARVPASPSLLALTAQHNTNVVTQPPPPRTPLIAAPTPTVVQSPRTPAPQTVEHWEVALNSSVWEHPLPDTTYLHESKTTDSQEPVKEATGRTDPRSNWAKARSAHGPTSAQKRILVPPYPFQDDEDDPLLL